MTGDDYNIRIDSAGFDQISFHDNRIYGFQFERINWQEHLLIDIDYISQWNCGDDGKCTFLIAPSTVKFENILDLKIQLDWGTSLARTDPKYAPIHNASALIIINDLVREPYQDPLYSGAQPPYLRYRFDLIEPKNGVLSFGASDFSLISREPALLCEKQEHPGRGTFFVYNK